MKTIIEKITEAVKKEEEEIKKHEYLTLVFRIKGSKIELEYNFKKTEKDIGIEITD